MCDTKGDEIVITGISGRFPESDNIYEFWDAIVNGVELSTSDDRRWPVGFMGLPPRAGKLKNPEKLDAQFFNITDKDADSMDAQLRMLHEVSYEAIIDAGIIPNDLRGSNTAIGVGLCYDDTSTTASQDVAHKQWERKLIRQGPSVLSNFFGFTGPSFEVDTACASSFTALFEGMQMMKAGQCDKLLVGGLALHLKPNMSRGFLEIKMISPDGRSKCLDSDVNGYCRSEAVNAIFVEKRSAAKRIYASIVAIDTNVDGFKPEGITFPGYETQKVLMQRTIKNSGIDPLNIDYIEAHVTGTVAGDTTETRSILDAYRKDSTKPIMFGCLKSNIGHSEGSSSNSSIAKVALIFQKHCIPPNTNFKTPNPNIPALVSGQIIPVIEKTDYHGEMIPVNSFGFGGVNVHALLKANEKIVTMNSYNIVDNIPRLVNLSGRTEEGMENAMKWIENNREEVTKDFLALLNDVSKTPLETGMNCRAFMIMDETNVVKKNVYTGDKRRPLWFVFSALGCQWKAMAKELMNFQLFSSSIKKCSDVAKTVQINLLDILTNENADVDFNIVNALVSIVSVQIALVDVLYFVGIKPEGIIGHSIGEVVAGYADGCLSAEEAVLTAYYIAKCSKDYQQQSGAMAAVGLSWEEAITGCPPGVYPACNNSHDGITVSGSQEAISEFVNQMNGQNVFAKQINSCNMAYHCPLVQSCFEPLVSELQKVIKIPKLRSNRMISTSSVNNGKGMFCDSFYYANNVVSPVKFKEAMKFVPENACVVEVGPSALLLPLVKRCLSSCLTVYLMNKNSSRNTENILSGIGDIYCSGNNVNIENLYPKVEYPVARETLSLSHLLQWDHAKNYFVPKYPEYFCVLKGTVKKEIDFMSKEFKFIDGHCIDGRNLIPATGYLYFIWNQFAFVLGGHNHLDFSVEFRNVKFNRATLVPKSGVTVFEMWFNELTGQFSVVEGGAECVSGFISIAKDEFPVNKAKAMENSNFSLSGEEIYRELRVRGYDYGPSFQGLIEAYSDGSKGKVKWTGHWISFTDSMLHLSILGSNERVLQVPTSIEYLRCDPAIFYKAIDKEALDVTFEHKGNVGYSEGIIIKGLKATPIARRMDKQKATIMNQCFTPYNSTVDTPEKILTKNEQYFEKCINLLHRIHANNFDLTEEDEKCCFNLDANNDFIFYKKLLLSLKEKRSFNETLQNIDDIDKETAIFKSNYDQIFDTQIRQIFENLPSRNLNILEYNATNYILKDEIIDIAENYMTKYEFNSLPVEGNGDSAIPPSLSNLDLIVYKDLSTELITDEKCLKSKEEVESLMDSFYTSLRDGGFLLFIFRTKLSSLETELLKLKNCGSFELHSEKTVIYFALEANFKIIGQRTDDMGIVSLILKKVVETHEPVILKTIYQNYEWVEELKAYLKDDKHNNTIWLYGDDNDFNGTLGLMRCIKKEPGGHKIRCYISKQRNIPNEVLQNDLIMNFTKYESPGAYVHKKIPEVTKEVKHFYLDVKTKGDLSSFRWHEAPHTNWSQLSDNEKIGTLIDVYYGALNFKDVMVASGRIPLNAYPHAVHALGNLGMEYSGIDEHGNRIMGITYTNSLATSLIALKNDLIWTVPNHWTLAEAATVPTVYLTVYYGLLIRGKLQFREKVLIHAGSGGVGQAAIAVCLSMGCEVFTSVGTEEKKQFLKNLFPQLEDKHFVNSRDVTFEEHILKETNGKGVDMILNSLAEEKLRASINCLADFGRFIEIGKYDIIQNNPIDTTLFTRNQTFHAICVAHLIADALVLGNNLGVMNRLKYLFNEALRNGFIKPIKAIVFDMKEAEAAFRFMAAGKHIGKVLLRMREENNNSNEKYITMRSTPQTFCFPSKVYLLFGGIGGLGLELALWLAHRGATKLVITSRTGIKNNYQQYMIKQIENYGTTVRVLVNNASTFESTLSVIEDAMELGPIGGVFNLSMVLKDALMENQTPETYEMVCTPKVNTTLYLDQITRKICPDLDYFVCFSSLACGAGNVGQSNYGFANSVMENICEKRREDKLHAIAIQWGPVGDTGFFLDLVKSNDVMILSCFPQRIPSFLNALDTLMNSPYAVCCSTIQAKSGSAQSGKKGDLLKTVCYILGLKDSSTLEDNTTLGNLGMDSLMAVEIKQGLEREYNTVLSTQEIRQLTIKDIKEISKKKVASKEKNEAKECNEINPFELPKQIFVNLDNGNQGMPIFFIPPIEGDFKHLQPMVKYITQPVIAINWTEEVNEKTTIEEVAAFYVQKLREEYPQAEYHFVAYSFGACVAFEMSLQLQAIDERLVQKIILLDGDIPTMSETSGKIIESLAEKTETDAYRELLLSFVSLSRSEEVMHKLSLELNSLNNKDELLNKTAEMINTVSGHQCNKQSLSAAIERYLNKMKRAQLYKPLKTFSGIVKFICSTTQTDVLKYNDETHIEFKKLVTGEIELLPKTGDHITFLTSNFEEIGNFIEAQFYAFYA